MHEVYLIVSFAVCINLSELNYDSAGAWINNFLVFILLITLVAGPIAIAVNVARKWKTEQ